MHSTKVYYGALRVINFPDKVNKISWSIENYISEEITLLKVITMAITMIPYIKKAQCSKSLDKLTLHEPQQKT